MDTLSMEMSILDDQYKLDILTIEHENFMNIMYNKPEGILNESVLLELKMSKTKIIFNKIKELWERFKKWFIEAIKNIMNKIREIKKKFTKDNLDKKIQSLKQKLNKLKSYNESVIYEEQNNVKYYELITPVFENGGGELKGYVNSINSMVNEALNNLQREFESINVEKINDYEGIKKQENTYTRSENNSLYKDFQEKFEKLLDNEDVKFIQDKRSLGTDDILEKKKFPANTDGSNEYLEEYRACSCDFSNLATDVDKQIKKLEEAMYNTDKFVSKFCKLNYKARENFKGKDEYVKLFSTILKGATNTFEEFYSIYKFIFDLTSCGFRNTIIFNKVSLDIDKEYNRIFNNSN